MWFSFLHGFLFCHGIQSSCPARKRQVVECLKFRQSVESVYVYVCVRMSDDVYACVLQRDFALKHLPDDPMFKLVSKLYETVPGVLQATGKVPFPCVQSLP